MSFFIPNFSFITVDEFKKKESRKNKKLFLFWLRAKKNTLNCRWRTFVTEDGKETKAIYVISLNNSHFLFPLSHK